MSTISIIIQTVLLLALFKSSSCRPSKFHGSFIHREDLCRRENIANTTECLMIMAQPILQDSIESLKSASEEELLKAREQYKLSQNPRKRRSSHLRCPVMDSNYFKNHLKSTGKRSLSPYHMVCVYNPHRIPEYMWEAKCLCRGCINKENGRQEHNVISAPVTTRVQVLKKLPDNSTRIEKETVTLGCTCLFPIVRN